MLYIQMDKVRDRLTLYLGDGFGAPTEHLWTFQPRGYKVAVLLL